MVDTQRTEKLRNAYRRWKQESSILDWFSLYRPQIADILPMVSGNAIKVYLFFCMNADPTTGDARHSVKAVADYLGRSERAVNDWIKELQEHGLIERIQETPNGEAHTYLLAKDWTSVESTMSYASMVAETPAQYPASDSTAPDRILHAEINPASNVAEQFPTLVDSLRAAQDYFHKRFFRTERPTSKQPGLFGQMIRNEREKRDMTLRDLSERTGMTMSYLFQLEQGDKTNPTLSTLVAISKGLSVPIGSLLGEAPKSG